MSIVNILIKVFWLQQWFSNFCKVNSLKDRNYKLPLNIHTKKYIGVYIFMYLAKLMLKELNQHITS